MGAEGEFKKRAVKEAFINVEDIIQRISKDEKGNSLLNIELPDEKYFTRMKDLFSWLDEATKEFPEFHENIFGMVLPSDVAKLRQWRLKWLGKREQ